MEEFAEKAGLLVVGAILTGLLVPYVKAQIDRRQFSERKKLEADLSRQAQVIDARAELIRELAGLVWSYYHLPKRLAYVRVNHVDDEIAPALKRYEDESWPLLEEARAKIGGMRWLLPREDHIECVRLYRALIDELHDRCPDIGADDDTDANWTEYYDWLHDGASGQIDFLLGFVADRFSLPGSS